MENVVNPAFWHGKRVFVTGHTGFKGSWLSLWLQQLGASLTGYALAPSTTPNLFDIATVAQGMNSIIGDIRDAQQLQRALAASQPQIVLHLAAQALVGEGYRDPLGTFATNVQGTANLLEAVRHTPGVEAVVVVTSDKCYENKEWPLPYREGEPLGGRDPYSSSKACAELVTAAYRNSFLAESGIAVASARAGNVFGGGDWSANRLIPDLLAAFAASHPGRLRQPQAVRPWQHVLEPLAGYLILAERIASDATLANAWNFGPGEADCLTAGEIAQRLARHWGGDAAWQAEASDFPHEAGLLRLDASLARQQLGWQPRWTLDQALMATISWHKSWLTTANMRAVTLHQIKEFTEHADT
ncbi:MAG: CDP-glucose 4,6-dehydratase [Proteobacteria bacterium]|nr:CDP-glucose 4,6-dehydratase [Pseudomonadota bacterium]